MAVYICWKIEKGRDEAKVRGQRSRFLEANILNFIWILFYLAIVWYFFTIKLELREFGEFKELQFFSYGMWDMHFVNGLISLIDMQTVNEKLLNLLSTFRGYYFLNFMFSLNFLFLVIVLLIWDLFSFLYWCRQKKNRLLKLISSLNLNWNDCKINCLW